MSLVKIIADKISGSVLGFNQALSKFTHTTFAQAGTSLPNVVKSANDTATNAIYGVGVTDFKLEKPIRDMASTAKSLDPANSILYDTNATKTLADTNALVQNSLPGYTYSLFDVQKSIRESLGKGVDSYATSVNTINPSITPQVTDAGMTALTETGRLSDKACTASYGSVTNFATQTVSNVNNTIADMASKTAKELEAKVASVRGVPNVPSIGPTITPLPTGNDTGTSYVTTVDTTTPTADTTSTNSVSQANSLSSSSLKIETSSVGIDELDEEETSPGEVNNNTDVIYQDVKIYVEGVQVPFEMASISQSIGNFPTAQFQIPPQAGLMDIARYYQPKVHIFYTDNNLGGDRLLFWGHIIACNYAYSRQSGSATVAFSCIHKNAMLQQIKLEWTGGGVAHAINGGSQTDSTPNTGAAQVNNFNSKVSLMRALQGIVGPQSDPKDLIRTSNPDVINADPTLLDERFKELEDRIVGMPAAIMNLWNQVKLEVFSNEKLNIIFARMFVPLMEDGIRFFDRLSGHVFLENQIQTSRVEHCNDETRPELSRYKTMLPPAFRLDIQSALQTQMAVSSLSETLSFSGEFTSFYELFTNFYYGVEYELLTLASPSEVPTDPYAIIDPDNLETWRLQKKMAIETIIKPQIPFYYAPVCNLLLPNMYHTLQVDQNEADIPTRVTAIGTAASSTSDNPLAYGINYRAPQSIREAIALGRHYLDTGTAASGSDSIKDLRETTGSSFNLPGKYEVGRGINHKKIFMPNWLSHFVKDKGSSNNVKTEDAPVAGSAEHQVLMNLNLAWIDRYGYRDKVDEETGNITSQRDSTLDKLNPYSAESQIKAFERLLFMSADYEYTKAVVTSKTGNVECLFNPYIVPGYPMDIISPTPNKPSFHAMCANVTHSFTSRSIITNVGFMAAITYTEMSNYYIQPIHPWLRSALSMTNIRRTKTLNENSSLPEDSSRVKTAEDTTVAELPAKDLPGVSAEAIKSDKLKKKLEESKDELNKRYGFEKDDAYDVNTGEIESVREGIIDNPRAKAVADNFYRSIFGVGSVDPGQVYDFNLGTVKPIARHNGNFVAGNAESSHSHLNGGEDNQNLTGVGGLRLVSRPIEGRRSIENKFEIKFIDLNFKNYESTSVGFKNEIVSNRKLLEPGASMFLEYPDIESLLVGASASAKS